MTINEAGQVEYRSVISALNWRQQPATLPANEGHATGTPGTCSGSTWPGKETTSSQLVLAVRVDALMQDLNA